MTTTTTSWKCVPIAGLPDGGIAITQWVAASPSPREATAQLWSALRSLSSADRARAYNGRAFIEAGGVVWFAVVAMDNYLVQYVIMPSVGAA